MICFGYVPLVRPLFRGAHLGLWVLPPAPGAGVAS